MSITIGIPFYNAEEFLADAIRSVFAQTYQDWELILIDDGSTDNSLAIAKSIKDPRVRVYSDGQNKKLASRLNEIVKLAKYDLIGRMDADDLMSPTRFEKQKKILDANTTLDLVTTGNFSLSNNMEAKGVRWHHSNSISLDDLLKKNGSGVLHAAILGRKSWFERNQYNPNIQTAQDYELWVRTAYNKDFNIYLMQEPLYYYREEGNVTSGKLLRAYSNERVLFDKYAQNNLFLLKTKSYLKTIIVKTLDLLNRTDVLLAGRSNIMDSNQLGVFDKELAVIKNTNVPGLD
jgi:glycosyltransferase involved in cell wall biosynthesis